MRAPAERFTPVFVVSSPLLPVAVLSELTLGHEPGTLPTEAQQALFTARLSRMFARPDVREAFFLTSAGMHAALKRWEAGTASPVRQAALQSLLFRALQRLCTATEPSGLAAGVVLGPVAAASRLELGPREHYGRVTRLSVAVLASFAEALNQDPVRAEHFILRQNPSAHFVDGALHLLRRTAQGTLAPDRRVLDEPERALFEAARDGASLHELGQAERVRQLLAAQVLVSDFAPPLMGSPPVRTLAEDLAAGNQRELSRMLRDFEHAVGNLDQGGLGHPPERYRVLEDSVAKLPGADVSAPRLFHVELSKCAEQLTLGKEVVAEVLAGAAALERIHPADDSLGEFAQCFEARFGAEAVPLLELFRLAPELAAELARKAPREVERESELSERLHRASGDTGEDGIATLALSSADLEALGCRRGKPPPRDSGHIRGTVLARSSSAVDRGEYRVHVDSVDPLSGGSVLTRFAHLEPLMLRAADELCRAEEALHPTAVLADVVCWPRAGLADQVLRPALRRYAICALARAAVGDAEVIPLSDLTVQVRDGGVMLRSRRLGREVLPRLAHSPALAPSGWDVLELLARVERTFAGAVRWRWEALDPALAGAAVLPRVTHGRCVLAPARFRLDCDEVASIRAASDPARALEEARQRLGAPDWCVLARPRGDIPGSPSRRQVLSFGNVLSVQAALLALPRRGACTLEEAFFAPEHLALHGPEGHYAHAFMLPVLREAGR